MDARDRPSARRGLEGDNATVGIDHATNDRQPEPRPGHRACGRCPVEAVEDTREVLAVDAGAVIADGDRPVAQAYLDQPTGRTPLARIVQHIDDRTLELVPAALDARGLEVELDGDIGRPQASPV